MHFPILAVILAPFLLGAAASSDVTPLRMEKRAAAKVITTCKKAGTFALTFDDGLYDFQARLRQTLDSRNSKATLFVNGQNWRCLYDNAEQLQATYLAGHTIGSHTWNHANITQLSAKQFEANLDQVEVALKKILGIKPALFRPPYGSYNQAQLNILAKRGYSTVLWSFDSGDSTGSTAVQSKTAYKKIAAKYPTPQIALNHETYKGTVYTVIPPAIEALQAKGYKLVTVDQCLGIKPYQEVYFTATAKNMPKRDASWVC